MNRDSRARILRRLHSAGPEISTHHHTPVTDVRPRMSARAGQTLLRETLIQNRAQVIDCTPTTLKDRLSSLQREYRWQNVIVGTHPLFTEIGLEESLSDCTVTTYQQAYESLKDTLFDTADAGVTTVQAAIADTGTLVVMPNEQEPRMLSLAPPVHIAILEPDCPIYANFDSLVAEAPWDTATMPSNILLISGPSKTADIQQTLAYGAHGPRELVVLMLSDEPSHPAKKADLSVDFE